MSIPTLIATPGASNANSFGTLLEADAYHASVLHPDAPWTPSVSATATLGSGTNGVVTVTVDEPGTPGNSYTIEVVQGVGTNVNLSAVLAGSKITVTLGTDGAGLTSAVKNTAILVAGAIGALAAFSASYSGTGATVVPVTAEKSFTGGTYYEETKIPALIMATQQLTALVNWTGDPSTTTQRLPWGRTGMEDRNGNSIPSNVIPDELKAAQFELARLFRTRDRTNESEISVNGITHLRAGPVTMKFRDSGDLSAGVIPSTVYNLLPESWYYSITGVASLNRDLLRA